MATTNKRAGAGAGPTAHMATTTFRVDGMTCGACTSAIETAFSNVDGVGNVSVSLVMGRAVVQHDPERINGETIKEMIEDRGFDADILSSDLPLPPASYFEEAVTDDENTESFLPKNSVTTVAVGGMTCGACTSAVEGAFKDVPGVKSFSISLMAERAVIEHDPATLSAEKIAELIEDTGFDASIVSTKEVENGLKTRHRLRRMSSRSKSTTTTVAIEGMTCGACTSAVEAGFKDVEGLIQFNISLLAERAVIVHNSDILATDKIVELIEDRGFDARIIKSEVSDTGMPNSAESVQLKIYGLTDAKSATDLETMLRSVSGVLDVKISFSTSRASIQYRSATAGLRQIVEVVEKAGYNALLAESDDNNAQLESLAKTKEIQQWRRAFQISLAFAIPVFLTSMIFPMLLPVLDYGSIALPIPGLWLGDVVCLILTIPVQFGIGRRFYRSAFKSLRHGSPTMDVLVVLGTSAAFFFSIAAMLVSILTPPHSRPGTVFDTSTMLITFISLGRYLENGAKSQTSRALSRLMSLAPSMATIYADPIAAEKLAGGMADEKVMTEKNNEKQRAEATNGDGALAEETTVPSELIQVRDVVILRPGDKIPADGTVIYGESYVDESMVTGEPMPILKSKGSLLMAGTVNGAGRLDFRVTRAGRDTQLSQIVRLVQEAQTSRAPMQRMADVVAGYFVPIIITLGLSTFVVWMVLSHVLSNPPKVFLDEKSGGRIMVCLKLCISVIVFACPCALGLSTPTAVMVGTGVGAEQGILVKGGLALETATKVTHVVFDKTGTLTTGKMSVAKTDMASPKTDRTADNNKAFWLALGLTEMSSEHPIARAIVRAAKDKLNLGTDGSFDGTVDEFSVAVGRGVTASVTFNVNGARQTRKVHAGNAGFFEQNRISILGTSKSDASLGSTAGMTTIYVAMDGTYSGALHLSDTLKLSAAATVIALARMGIPCSIVTGDAPDTAHAIAAQVNISKFNVHASASPDRKQELIRELQEAGHVVAMVGDGINDSPALATANIGISMASGTDVAMEAADIVLMRPDDLLDVAASLHLARTIFNRIKLNLAWATGYNFIGLPFAMGIFLPWGLRLHPMAAGAAMACSSVSVVVSSLLLKFWKRPSWMHVEALERSSSGGGGGNGIRQGGVSQKVRRLVNSARRLVGMQARRQDIAYVPLSSSEAV